MAGDALDTITRFWAIQDGGDYSLLAPLFSDDAVLEDPVFGTFTGGPAIAAFMAKMNVEMAARGASFRLVEAAGDDDDGVGAVGGDHVGRDAHGRRHLPRA